jgi:RNA polymerase sigma factor (sigma-70 family)
MATAAPEIPVLARDQAFESMYRSYVKDVYHYALALLRNPADAEDVTQTTFLNAYRAYQQGIEVEKPQNWLIKIAHNVARTRYAYASRRVKEVPLEDHVDQLAVPEADRPDVTGVLRALGRLPFNQRAALVMRELEGRSYAEIADTIGVSVSAVETLIFRARKSLRLKASALRVLGVVPLPSSLAQLFDGGGAVAGGGAVVGTGLLLKAAVALVAGVLATGMTGDHRGTTAAAADAVPRIAAGTSWHRSDGFMVRPIRTAGINAARTTTGNRPRRGSVRPATRMDRAAHVGALAGLTRRPRTGPGSGATNGSPAAPSSTSSKQSTGTAAAGAVATAAGTVANPAATAASVVATVQQAAAQAPVALPPVALPVPAPSLPPPPVPLPPVPGIPLP